MDPIRPISPREPGVRPVGRAERRAVKREDRERQAQERRERERREHAAAEQQPPDEGDEGRRVDVRA